jgi:hypothetical protein
MLSWPLKEVLGPFGLAVENGLPDKTYLSTGRKNSPGYLQTRIWW